MVLRPDLVIQAGPTDLDRSLRRSIADGFEAACVNSTY
jgi:hypothetical protein